MTGSLTDAPTIRHDTFCLYLVIRKTTTSMDTGDKFVLQTT